MSWIQSFNQAYPGALQYLQAGGFVQTPSRARLPNPNWGRAHNFGFGAIGPAIGLSPMVYGIPFPGYPSLAQQQKVGVSPAESQQWREVYAAQMRDRGVMANPLPDWCPSPITTKIKGSKWCYDPKSGGWLCAEPSGHCNVKGERPGLWRLMMPGRRRPGRLLRRARARRGNPDLRIVAARWLEDVAAMPAAVRARLRNPDEGSQASPWPPTPGYGTGQHGAQYGPNRELNAPPTARRRGRRLVRRRTTARSRVAAGPTSPRVPKFKTVCCRWSGAQCMDPRVCYEGTIDCCPARNANAARRGRLSRSRLRAAPGKARMPEPQCEKSQRCGGHHHCSPGFGCVGGCCKKGVQRNPARQPNGCAYCGQTFCCGPDMTIGKCCKLKGGHVRRAGRLRRSRFRTKVTPARSRWRVRNEAQLCDPGACATHRCGKCDPGAYAVPGAVDTVDQAVAQSDADVDFAMHAANAALREMYAPGATAWADPSVAILQKPGGPAPVNPMTTAQWPTCAAGPAVVADPSSNRQPLQR